MARNITFGTNEWYHCLNRGVDKRRTFMDNDDYARFQALLYACNSTFAFRAREMKGGDERSWLTSVFVSDRGEPLVDIGAYALMPNHYHVLLRERQEGGISIFMQRLGTAYTMYFNQKHDRKGALFSGRFRARHVNRDTYLKRVVNYIHGNPAELFEPLVKSGEVQNLKTLTAKIQTYPFCSLIDYEGEVRQERAILSIEVLESALHDPPSTKGVVDDFRTFYAGSNMRLWITG